MNFYNHLLRVWVSFVWRAVHAILTRIASRSYSICLNCKNCGILCTELIDWSMGVSMHIPMCNCGSQQQQPYASKLLATANHLIQLDEFHYICFVLFCFKLFSLTKFFENFHFARSFGHQMCTHRSYCLFICCFFLAFFGCCFFFPHFKK